MPAKVLEWLLEDKQPAVRYYTLVDLLDRPLSDPEVASAREAIPLKGWAADILRLQKASGFWESSESLYRPKYIATNWRLIVLTDLGLTGEHPRIRRSAELFLRLYARPDGGFGRTVSHFCVTGNLVRVLIKCGYREDPKVGAALDWLVREQKKDGGWHCFNYGYGTLDCWEALSAFAALPRQRWSPSVRRAVGRGAEFYLEKRLWRQGKKRYEPWFRFHYPVHYYYDILVGLDILTSLGYSDDERLRPALKVLREKRRSDGTWLLDAVHPDVAPDDPYKLIPPYEPQVPTPFALEKAGRPSKWVTLTALRVLKRVEGGPPRS